MQSYGEEPGKGYLLWEIRAKKDFDVTFKKIEHDREFWTIDWKGTIKDTVSAINNVPKGARIRVRSNALITQTEVKQLTNEIKAVRGASEVVFKDEHIVDSNVIDTQNISLQKTDLRDPDIMLKLFREFFKEDEFSDKEWVEVRDMIKKYTARAVVDDQTARGIRWSLKEMTFDNTFGYGSGNRVNFKNLRGITGIFGANRIGKSSLLGTLLFALFNQSDRGSIKNLHMINIRYNHCVSTVVITVNGKDYRVSRQSVRNETKAGHKHAITSLNFDLLNDDGTVKKELNGEQRKDTEKEIRKLIGSPEDFMMTALASQDGMNKFIDAGTTTRDQIISRLLDVVIFDKINAYVKEDSSLIKAQVKNAPDVDWDSTIAQHKDKILQYGGILSTAEKSLSAYREELDVLKVKLATSKHATQITPGDVERQKKKLAQLLNNLKSDMSVKEQVYASMKSNKELLSNTEMLLSEISINELNEKAQSIHNLKRATLALKHEHEKAYDRLKLQRKSVLKLADVPCDDKFPGCKYIKDSHRDKALVITQESKVAALMKDVEESEKALTSLELESVESKIKEHGMLVKKKIKLDTEIAKSKASLDSTERDIADMQKNIANAEYTLSDYTLRVVDTTDDKTDNIKTEIGTLQTKVNQIDKNRILVASEQGSLKNEIERLTKERDEYKGIRTKWKLFEMFTLATSKKGIPTQIIESQLPVINSEIQKTLQGIVNFTLRFEKDEGDDRTNIYIDYGDSKRLIELGSGMEKMISSLAIRVALQNASSLPRPDFLIIDEGFGTLDESSIEACNRMLASLKRWYKNILVISHIDGVKDITDNLIEITRPENTKDSLVICD